MQARQRIVFLDSVTPSVREALATRAPAGFELVFADPTPEEAAVAAAATADFIVVWAGHLPARVVQAATRAKLIQKIGEGTDRIDIAAASRMGIPVAKTTGSNRYSVAEAATLLILATLRWLPRAHNSTVAGEWLKFELRPGAFEIRGKQVGIIGTGKIGKIVAEHMKGLGARVVYHDLIRLSEGDEVRLGATKVPMDELLRTSDVVTLHVPLTPSTRGMIGARELSLMKPTAILVNTCRGPVVDEGALFDALKEQRIRGAGLDVWTKEPPGRDNPLLSLDNVVVTPHLAGGTEDAELEGIAHAFRNVVKVASGEPLDPADIAPIPQ